MKQRNRNRRQKVLLIKALGIVLAFFCLALAGIFMNRWEIDIEPVQGEKVTVSYGKKYKDKGAKAYYRNALLPFIKEEIDVKESGQVNTKKMGTYTITYEASSHGQTAKVTQTVEVKDNVKPVITYGQDPSYKVLYTAKDNLDGDLTDKVKTKVEEDQIIYSVTDSSGNTAKVSRPLKRYHSKPSQDMDFTESERTIYLTFDDGPSKYTDTLLDVLKKYNIKATFFTTSAYPDYADRMKRQAEEGHAVCVHTATHNYAQIYKSTDAYWADYNQQKKVIEQQTSSSNTMFRFPGGSSNTVSQQYGKGIMTKLVKQAEDKGLQYFDWNVSSGDAGGTESTDQVFLNVISVVQANREKGVPSVVLQHDTNDFSVAAVERIILWGLDNGYEFQPLHANSYAPHHGTVN
ncbi:MAG: polysaccharide deacetylase [Erysipelotrichaceae bacterium]|nr:polysaccharide deacetylase [Erysipelotrichaceae bacterium]